MYSLVFLSSWISIFSLEMVHSFVEAEDFNHQKQFWSSGWQVEKLEGEKHYAIVNEIRFQVLRLQNYYHDDHVDEEDDLKDDDSVGRFINESGSINVKVALNNRQDLDDETISL